MSVNNIANGDQEFLCTACAASIKSTYKAALHPLLNVLICRKCFVSYGTGDWSNIDGGIDEEGDDNYCRWCSDGGTLYGCTKNEGSVRRCHYSFCKDCVVRNFPHDPILEADNQASSLGQKFKWICYACDESRLNHLRVEAFNALKYLNSKDKIPTPLPKDVTRQDIDIKLKNITAFKDLLMNEFNDRFSRVQKLCLAWQVETKDRKSMATTANEGLGLAISEFPAVVSRLQHVIDMLP